MCKEYHKEKRTDFPAFFALYFMDLFKNGRKTAKNADIPAPGAVVVKIPPPPPFLPSGVRWTDGGDIDSAGKSRYDKYTGMLWLSSPFRERAPQKIYRPAGLRDKTLPARSAAQKGEIVSYGPCS